MRSTLIAAAFLIGMFLLIVVAPFLDLILR